MGFVLLATFLGFLEAVIGATFGASLLEALAIWTFGGLLSAMALLALSRLRPPGPAVSIDILLRQHAA